MSKTITHLYDRYEDAKAAVSELERIGVSHSDISIVANNAHGEHLAGSEAAEDAGKGAGTGAAIGGLGGLLAGLGVLAIPGLGPVVAAGWLASTAVGAGVGAAIGGAAGGLVGALQKEGVSEHDAHVYSEGVRRGGTLVSAKVPDNLVPEAEAVLNRSGAVNPVERGNAYREAGWSRFDETAPAYDREQIETERQRYARDERVI
jgi:hypothetical protein